ncbi:MAG TPA: hypothetical protein VMZ22_12220 [Acidimicrobiales bacterium]|nr:hypothetical protein [Acidimicrobiales bacterium]
MQMSSRLTSSRLPTVVMALAIVLALIGVVGIAAGAADKPDDDNVAVTGSTTTTTQVDGPSTTLPGYEGPSTTGADGTTATTRKTSGTTSKPGSTGPTAACPAPPPATANPGPHQPPAVGTYTYASCSDSEDTEEQAVSAGASSGGVTRRNVSDNTSGFPQTATLAFGPSGVLLESLSVSAPQGKLNCDFQPDVVNYPPSISVGSQWTADSSCDLKQEGNPATIGKITIKGSGKVSGKVVVSVGGTSVNAWVVEGDITLTFDVTGFGSGTTHVKSKDYYDPAHGVDVYRHAESTSQEGTETFEQRLVSLTPKS